MAAGGADAAGEVGGERTSLAERAYRSVKRSILENEMPAGTMLLEHELAARLAMSRTPIREALVRLAEEGMVELRPRHGMRVLPVSAEDMREIYQILTALEAEAAGEIARAGLAAQDVESLRETVREMDEALAADDLVAWARADDRFHRRLIAQCPNRRLTSLIAQFWDRSHRVRMLTLRLRPKPSDSNRDHLALVDAMARGDAEQARQIHREHRVRHGEMLVRLLKEHGLTQL